MKPLLKPLVKPQETVTSLFRSAPTEIGLSPGTLIHVGDKKMETPVISFIDYDADHLIMEKDVTVERCLELKITSRVSWINLDGIDDISVVEGLGRAFDLHPLTLEDILNTDHRPKIEDFNGALVIIVKMLDFDERTNQLGSDQISLVLTADNVLTFQEIHSDVFDGVRARLTRKSGSIRQRGPDYLAYALLDSIVDSYFHTLEKIGDRLETLEEELILQPSQDTLQQIHHFKGQLIFLRKSVWPLRELAHTLLQEEYVLIKESTNVFLRDLYDHTVQIIDTVEIFRDAASGLVELYISSGSHRLNEVMRVLTVMASLFIPLTFIVGVYGMNFEHMPELKLSWGYPAVWGVMILCVIGMLIFFKRKKWF